jgi:hypothetical protein
MLRLIALPLQLSPIDHGLRLIRGVVVSFNGLGCQRRYAFIIIRQLEQFSPDVSSRLVRRYFSHPLRSFAVVSGENGLMVHGAAQALPASSSVPNKNALKSQPCPASCSHR